jgi:hypothetical protein
LFSPEHQKKAKIQATLIKDCPLSSLYLSDLLHCLSLVLEVTELKLVGKVLSTLDPGVFPLAVSVPLGLTFHGTFEVSDLTFHDLEPSLFEIPDSYILQRGEAYSSVRVEKADKEERIADEGAISDMPEVNHTHVSNLVTDHFDGEDIIDNPLDASSTSSKQIQAASKLINKSLQFLLQRFQPQKRTLDADI